MHKKLPGHSMCSLRWSSETNGERIKSHKLKLGARIQHCRHKGRLGFRITLASARRETCAGLADPCSHLWADGTLMFCMQSACHTHIGQCWCECVQFYKSSTSIFKEGQTMFLRRRRVWSVIDLWFVVNPDNYIRRSSKCQTWTASWKSLFIIGLAW